MFSVPVSVRSIVRVAYAVVSVVVSKNSILKSADVTVPSLFPRVVVNEVVCPDKLDVSVIVPLSLVVSMRQFVKVIEYESAVVPADIDIVLSIAVVKLIVAQSNV